MENIMKILKILYDGKYHTADEISKSIKISPKTVRNKVKEANDILKVKNITIESKSSQGFILLNSFKNIDELFIKKFDIPTTSSERINYIILKLIENDKYLKLEELSEEIFISTKTLSLDMKRVERYLKKFNISIERKPYYGFKIVAEELNIRNAYIDIYESKISNNNLTFDNKEKIDNIAEKTKEFFKIHNIKGTDISFQHFIISVFVTISRINKKHKILNSYKKINLIEEEKYNKCIDLLIEYSKFLNLELDKNELDYLSNSLMVIDNRSYINENEEVRELIKEIVYYIKLMYKIDIKNEEKLIELLYNHIFSLLIRMRYKLYQKNPILNDIKSKLVFEYNISLHVCELISKKYNENIPEDEVGYIALILGISNEINKQSKKAKKNVLIVCPMGQGVSKFMVHTYEGLFSKYCNYINSCSERELDEINLEVFDVIFSVKPLDLKISIPIYPIKTFLEEEDINEIKEILFEDSFNYKKIFPKELFLILKEKQNKYKIIKNMSIKIKEKYQINEDIEKFILEREKIGMTEIKKKIAIPHSIKEIDKIEGLGVVLSKEEVFWEKSNIRIIIFLCLNKEQQKNEKIYMLLNKIIEDENLRNKLLSVNTYEEFIEIIKRIR